MKQNYKIRFQFALIMLATLLLSARLTFADSELEKFPLATIVEEEKKVMPEYRFVTGKLSSIGALVRTEQESIVSGKLVKGTYEIPRVHKTQEVMEHYQAQLQGLKASTLFFCEGRDCGRSNDWANEIFNERILYGPDRYQYYLAATFQKASKHYAVAVYTIRRGNQRVYAHVEQLELDEPFGADDQESGVFLVTEEDLSSLRELKVRLEEWLAVESANEDPVITLVTYSRYSNKSRKENYLHAASIGKTLNVYLAREVLPEKNIKLINVGPYAPGARFAKHDSFLELFVD